MVRSIDDKLWMQWLLNSHILFYICAVLPCGCGCIQWLRDFLAAHFPELERHRLWLRSGQVCTQKAYVLKLFQYPEGRKAPIIFFINVFKISLNLHIGFFSKSNFWLTAKTIADQESLGILFHNSSEAGSSRAVKRQSRVCFRSVWLPMPLPLP